MARVVVTGSLVTEFADIRATGRSFQVDQAVICHVLDGKIAEAWEIVVISSLLEQVGT